MAERLADERIDEKLGDLWGWDRLGDNIERNFEFKDFEAALAFVNKVAAEAQAMDHHPDIFLHDWNQVRITCTTHSAKGITENDIELARRVNGLNN